MDTGHRHSRRLSSSLRAQHAAQAAYKRRHDNNVMLGAGLFVLLVLLGGTLFLSLISFLDTTADNLVQGAYRGVRLASTRNIAFTADDGDLLAGRLVAGLQRTTNMVTMPNSDSDKQVSSSNNKNSTDGASVSNLSLNFEVDGEQVQNGDRIILPNQDNKTQNGIYVYRNGRLSRASDMQRPDQFSTGLNVYVSQGITYGRSYLATRVITQATAAPNTKPDPVSGYGIEFFNLNEIQLNTTNAEPGYVATFDPDIPSRVVWTQGGGGGGGGLEPGDLTEVLSSDPTDFLILFPNGASEIDEKIQVQNLGKAFQINTALGTSALTGGGVLSSPLDLAVDILNTTSTIVAEDADLILIHDVSTNALRSITRANLLGGTDPNEFSDALFRVFNTVDNTKKLAFDCVDITTGTTRTATWPDADTWIPGITQTQAGYVEAMDQSVASTASPTFNVVTVGNTGLVVGVSTPFSDAAGTLTFQNIDAVDATTVTTFEAALTLDQINGWVADENIDHSTVQIATAAGTSGLTGGGDITATRNLSVDIVGTTLETVAENADLLLMYDDSASALKRISLGNIFSGVGPTTFSDAAFRVFNSVDNTKVLAFDCVDITTGTTRTATWPDADTWVPGITQTQAGYVEAMDQSVASTASPTFNVVTVGNTGLVVGVSTPFSDAAGTLTFQNVDAVDATTVTTFEAALTIDQINGWVANENIDHSTVQIATAAGTSGLTGGGDITATRNLSVDIVGTTLETTAANADLILMYDDSASALRSISLGNVISGVSPTTFSDAAFRVFNSVDNTKVLAFDCVDITTGTTRTATWPDSDTWIPGITQTQAGYVEAMDQSVATTDTVEFTRLGLGTSTVPHGGVGYAIAALNGPASSSDGPHVQYTVDTDNFPLRQDLNFTHDNISMAFDAYYDGNWRSSDAGSNFLWLKQSDRFTMLYDNGVAAGSIVTWNTGWSLSASTGYVGIGVTGGPNYPLEIVGGSVSIDNASGYRSQTSGGTSRNLIASNGDDSISIGDGSGGSWTALRFFPGAAETMRIISGSVGINDTTPSFNLDVNGTFRVTGTAQFDDTVVFDEMSANKIGVGTTTIPHGGVGWGIMAVNGPSGSADGPHVQYTTDDDDFPVRQDLNWDHDFIYILFNSYWNGAWRSSDAGSNYSLAMTSDTFRIRYDSGVAPGGTVNWNEGILLDTSGDVTVPTGLLGVGTSSVSGTTTGVTILSSGSIGSNFANRNNNYLNISDGTTRLIMDSNEIQVVNDTQGADLFIQSLNTAGNTMLQYLQGGVSIGTRSGTDVPIGGIGAAVLVLTGPTDTVTGGPHAQYNTTTDDYPVRQDLNWSHDNVQITLDGYYDGVWRSSDVGSNYQIRKSDDLFRIRYDSGVALGSAVTWNEGIIMNTSGQVGINETDPASILHCTSSVYPVFTSERTSSDTNTTLGAGRFLHTTTSNMVDGFGASIYFSIQDSANVVNDMGYIGGVRTGADNSGALQFATVNAGVQTVKMALLPGGQLGLGTTTVPHGGVGAAKFAIDGVNLDVTDGPHLQITTDADDYPLFQMLNFRHDNINMAFDAYYDGTWTSSDAGSNFYITKFDDNFEIRYDSGVAPGSPITWNDGITLTTAGFVGIGIGTPAYQLHVHENSTASAYISVTNSSTGTSSSDGVQLGIDSAHSFLISRENTQMDFYTNDLLYLTLTNTGKLGLGTDTVPHGGIGAAKFAIDGTLNSINGPHVQFTTTEDNYPTMQFLNWRHGDVHIIFDAYYDGSYRSSDSDGNFALVKSVDDFILRYDSGLGLGSVISWNVGTQWDTSGNMNIPNGGVNVGWTGTSSNQIHIKSTGDASIKIEADTDNSGEEDNPTLVLSQDGGLVITQLGMNGSANNTYSGANDNSAYLVCEYGAGLANSGCVQFGTDSTIRMTIDRDGRVGINDTNPSNTTTGLTIQSSGTIGSTFADRNNNYLNITDGTVRMIMDSNEIHVVNATQGDVLFIQTLDTAGNTVFHSESGGISIGRRSGSDVPIGGVGSAVLAVTGTLQSVTDGPHVQYNITADDFPVRQDLNWDHDNVQICLDCYYDGNWRSSDSGSNFQIRKNSDIFRVRYDSGVAAGGLITWNEGFQLNTSGDVFVPTGRFGVSTDTVPHGAVGYAKVAIDGTNGSSDGPHVQYTTTSDNFPARQDLIWGHDDMNISFDAYYDGAWRSSDSGSNFQFIKGSDTFRIRYDSGIAQGGVVTWNTGFTMDTSGDVTLGSDLTVTGDVSANNFWGPFPSSVTYVTASGSGSVVFPVGTKACIVELQAGGGGGGGPGTSTDAAGGGGSGSFVTIWFTASDLSGETGFNYVVGAGGAGGTGTNNGADGGNSTVSFTVGPTLIGTTFGGQGGTQGNAYGVPGLGGDIATVVGGYTSQPSYGQTGSQGHDAGTVVTNYTAGSGGNSRYGRGGHGAFDTGSGSPADGTLGGGGGGGADDTFTYNGADGGDGFIRILWFS